MKIIKSKIESCDISSYVTNITREDHKRIFIEPPGKNHYKLLAYLSLLINDKTIIELGTHHGTSSLALSINKTNTIITYDIADRYGIVPQPDNVKRRIGNIFSLNEQDSMLSASIIFLDTAHEGDFEWQVYTYLRDNNYNGILLLDDIHWNDAMQNFWNKIDTLKYDITDIGHGECPAGLMNYTVAGTGLVDFSGKVLFG
jgi:hypothetical protein